MNEGTHTVNDSKRRNPRHGSTARLLDLVLRYRRAVLLRFVYGAATATGTTAVGLIAVVLERHL